MTVCDFSTLPTNSCDHCAKSQVKDPLAYTQRLALELMQQHGLLAQGWRFGFDNPRKRLGQCNYVTRMITVSAHWAKVMPEEQIRETILHEIAHALAGSHAGHGPGWRAIALRIGSDGTRCASVPGVKIEEKPAWTGTCPACSKSVGQYRAPLRVSACSDCCRGGYKVRYALRWTKNGQPVSLSSMPKRYQTEMNRLEIKYPSWAFDHTNPANYR